MYPYRYASPFSVASSGVSTPAMTPPLMPPMLESMLAHQPGWNVNSHESMILMRISELQTQTAQLVALLKQSQQQQPLYYPSFIAHAPACPTPPVSAPSQSQEAFMAAQAVFASVPRNNHLDEPVLARAVVAAAQALVANRSGFVPNLRHDVVIPEAVRSQTPAWISQAAAANDDFHPAPPEFGSPRTVMKCARKTSPEE